MGVHLSPLGFAACQSKKCTNISLSAPILNPPTEFTEFTEQTGKEYSPTDFTELHRYLLPQNSRNTQNILLTSV